jgi:DNA-binding CsgD family transcriptional regulator
VTPVLVGRDAEQCRIDELVDALAAGPPAGLTIRGEAGIGKTALWRHGLERCREAGFQVLVARPAEEEMPLAFVGLVDLFDRSGLDVASLRAGDDPYAGGRAVLTALREQVVEAPTVVAVDDVQWLDSASARSLRYALRRLDPEPVGLLTTCRVGPGADDPLVAGSTLPPGRHQAVDLGPLSLDALRLVLTGTVTAISRPMLRRIHEVSGGNPLYALELGRGLSEEARSISPAELPLPDSLHAAIAQRLETVPHELVPLLEAAAALGPASVKELQQTLGEPDLDRPLAQASQLGLLVVDEELEVRFSHPLIGSVVFSAMSPLARRSLHARLAERTDDRELRARHLALSTDEPDREIAALLEAAAARAEADGAYDIAADFARHSLRLTPAGDSDALSRAQAEIANVARAGDVGRALALADGLVATLPAGPGRAEALIQRSDVEADDPAVSLAFLERALDDAGDDGLLRARVLQEIAYTRFLYHGDLHGAINDAREALEIAQGLEDARLAVDAAAGLAHLESIAGRPQPDVMMRAVRFEEQAGTSALNRNPRGLVGKQLRWAGELDEARRWTESAAVFEYRTPYRMYDVALIECAAGNLALAEELVTGGLEAARDAGDQYGERAFLYPKALVEALQGSAEQARATARGLLERATRLGERLDVVAAFRVLGLLSLSEGNAATAAGELGAAALLVHELGIGHPGFYAVLPDAVEAYASAGDVAAAEALCERLGDQARAVGGAWANAVAERSEGWVTLAQGDPDPAAAAFERTAATFDRLGHRLDAARTLLALGGAQLRGGRRSLALEALGEARGRFAAIGASLWEARALELLERAAPGAGAGRLTEVEARVAGLVAEGLRNREIAESLFMSIASVEAHLTRIYRKLEVRSRSELTRLVADGEVQTLDVGPPPGGVGETR